MTSRSAAPRARRFGGGILGRGLLAAVALAGAVLAAAVLVASPAPALSPPDQYQTFDRASELIEDRYTGLTWQRAVPASTFTSVQAAAYCEGLTVAGVSGFRLPSYRELVTLVDDVPHKLLEGNVLVSHAIDPNAFFETPAASFWTSDPVASGDQQQWAVEFATGTSVVGRAGPSGDTMRVRCVRGGAP